MLSIFGSMIVAGVTLGVVWRAGTPTEANLGTAFTESAYTVDGFSVAQPGGKTNGSTASGTAKWPASPSTSLPVFTFTTDRQALGIAAGSSLPSLNDQQLAARLDGIKAAGARWVRFDMAWSEVQQSNSTSYNWKVYDRIVEAINARGMSMLAILDYTPAWARQSACSGTDKCAPADPSQFATFAAAAAQRYAPEGVHYWEIWNEPNSSVFWQPAADPAAYVALLRDTYAALHHADSRAYVITAGLSPQATGDGNYAPYDFLDGIYKAGAHGHFDAVADHPYTFPLSPADDADDAWTQMARQTHSLRSLMVANGDSGKKIWITEFGAPTGGPGPVSTVSNPNLANHPYVVDQGRQAKLLSDAIKLYHSYAWAGPFLYYSYQDAGTDPSTNENFFGLVTASGVHKQAYAVFQAAAK